MNRQVSTTATTTIDTTLRPPRRYQSSTMLEDEQDDTMMMRGEHFQGGRGLSSSSSSSSSFQGIDRDLLFGISRYESTGSMHLELLTGTGTGTGVGGGGVGVDGDNEDALSVGSFSHYSAGIPRPCTTADKKRLASFYRPRHVTACDSAMSLLSMGSETGRFVAPNISFTPNDIIMMEWDHNNNEVSHGDDHDDDDEQRIRLSQRDVRDALSLSDYHKKDVVSEKQSQDDSHDCLPYKPPRSTISCDESDNVQVNHDNNNNSSSMMMMTTEEEDNDDPARVTKKPIMFGHAKREQSTIYRVHS